MAGRWRHDAGWALSDSTRLRMHAPLDRRGTLVGGAALEVEPALVLRAPLVGGAPLPMQLVLELLACH